MARIELANTDALVSSFPEIFQSSHYFEDIITYLDKLVFSCYYNDKLICSLQTTSGQPKRRKDMWRLKYYEQYHTNPRYHGESERRWRDITTRLDMSTNATIDDKEAAKVIATRRWKEIEAKAKKERTMCGDGDVRDPSLAWEEKLEV